MELAAPLLNVTPAPVVQRKPLIRYLIFKANIKSCDLFKNIMPSNFTWLVFFFFFLSKHLIYHFLNPRYSMWEHKCSGIGIFVGDSSIWWCLLSFSFFLPSPNFQVELHFPGESYWEKLIKGCCMLAGAKAVLRSLLKRFMYIKKFSPFVIFII